MYVDVCVCVMMMIFVYSVDRKRVRDLLLCKLCTRMLYACVRRYVVLHGERDIKEMCVIAYIHIHTHRGCSAHDQGSGWHASHISINTYTNTYIQRKS